MSGRLLLPPEVESELDALEMLLDETGCRRLNRIRGFLLSAYRERDDLAAELRRHDLADFEARLMEHR
jgi:hypothetical protein